MTTRKKMSGRKLRRKVIPALVMIALLAYTVTFGMLNNTSILNTTFGNGSISVSSSQNSTQELGAFYPQLYKSSSEARSAAFQVSTQISNEGIVLLKNDGLLPLKAQTPIAPFGLRYCSAYYGGTGSSAIGTGDDYVVTPSEGLHSVFPNVHTQLESLMESTLAANNEEGLVLSSPLAGSSETNTLSEFDSDIYLPAAHTLSDHVGIVYIGRRTGEGQDASSSIYSDGSSHMLALSSAELDTIQFAKDYCKNIVIVIASSAPMEIACLEDDPAISAVLWIGGTGSTGYASLAQILVGNVNPSGRLPDTWTANFKYEPTFANLDDGSDRFVYANARTTLAGNYGWTEDALTPFREYEEGIYFGYRFYETAYAEGALEDYFNRADGVVYPFGHGLSYTTFQQEILTCSRHDDAISLTVRVTNTGLRYSGKAVVQLYATSPYTTLDQKYGIEKSAAILVAFGKSELLLPGQQQTLSFSIQVDDLASYCYTHQNSDGTTGCYVVEEGNYILTLRENAHDVLDTASFTISHTVWYEGNNARLSEKEAQAPLNSAGTPNISPITSYQAATNQFQPLNDYMISPDISNAVPLSRSNWTKSQPSAPTDADCQASQTVIEWIRQADSTNAEAPIEKSPEISSITSAKGPLSLADLRGKDYDDIMWDQLMDQLDFADPDEIYQCLFGAGYHTASLTEIGKPESAEYDGAQGLTLADIHGNNHIRNVCAYPSAPIMAATWNPELLYEFGYMLGQEALTAGISGWYSPALNIHRSPFSGRVSEYFSEDPLLTGTLGAFIISGASDAGVCCVVKHFALMETENHKNPHTNVWMTEQALREIYLRPYEIALSNSRKTIVFYDEENDILQTRIMRVGCMVMASDCAIGAQWSAANSSLLTEVLREEWGFEGAVITDMHLYTNGSQLRKILEAGCDMMMSTSSNGSLSALEVLTTEDQPRLQLAVKNLCYCLANSNLMQGITPGSHVEYHLPLWQTVLVGFDGVIAGGILITLIWLILRSRHERRHPEQYTEE